MPIHEGNPLHEGPGHGDVGNIRLQRLIRPVDHYAFYIRRGTFFVRGSLG